MSAERSKYEQKSDHDLMIESLMTLDALADKLDAFIIFREKLQEKYECRMGDLEKKVETHGTRLNTLETYIKVGVGFIVVAMSIFGVYILDLFVRGG